jgi:hypothetical protein
VNFHNLPKKLRNCFVIIFLKKISTTLAVILENNYSKFSTSQNWKNKIKSLDWRTLQKKNRKSQLIHFHTTTHENINNQEHKGWTMESNGN